MPEESSPNKPLSKETIDQVKKKTNKNWIILFVILIILLLAGLFGYLVYFEDKTDTKEPVKSMEAEKTATPSAITKTSEPEWECDKQTYENESQGYKVCFESGWVKREFDPPSITVGFDPNYIPEASEYFGLIAVSISSSDIDDAISALEDSLDSTSTSTTEVDGVSAQQVSGTVPANQITSGGPTIRTLFAHFDRLYVVTLTTDNTESRQFYDDFLDSWQFLDSASEPSPE